MPPKKAAGAAQAAKAVNKKQAAASNDKKEEKSVPDRTKQEEPSKEEEMKDAPRAIASEDEKRSGETAQAGDKRKSPPEDKPSEKPPKKEAKKEAAPKKEPRQGERQSGRSKSSGSDKSASSKQILNFLLSKAAIEYCYPSDELDAARSGKFNKSYSLTPPSLFTPFEHLITAHLLSKPLSHTLSMRATRTLLNEPYKFSTPQSLRDAGYEKIHQALDEARTQHRQKTAEYLADMGERFCDPNSKDNRGDADDSDEMLELAIKANEDGPQGTIKFVTGIKGMGPTGAQIFCRRIQAVEGWGEDIWPYIDGKGLDALRECGIKVADGDDLQEMIERDVDWDKIGDMGLVEEKKGVDEKDLEVQTAVEFVTAIERAVGCVLEGKVDEMKRAAGG